jgi:transcriptional regulator with XRE-family HTH domain
MGVDRRIGLRVRAFRKTKGLTQAELAELAYCSLDAISSFERGKYIPSLATAVAIARALDISLTELVGEESNDSLRRSRLLAALAAAGRSLSDADLETAVEQVNALGRRRKR